MPRAGMAVIHFPTTSLDLCGSVVPDPRTMHESEAAIDEKYVVQQFIWSVPIEPSNRDIHEDVRAEWSAILAHSK